VYTTSHFLVSSVRLLYIYSTVYIAYVYILLYNYSASSSVLHSGDQSRRYRPPNRRECRTKITRQLGRRRHPRRLIGVRQLSRSLFDGRPTERATLIYGRFTNPIERSRWSVPVYNSIGDGRRSADRRSFVCDNGTSFVPRSINDARSC